MGAERMPQLFQRKEGSWTGVKSASRSLCCLVREAPRAHSKDNDDPKRATGETDGQFLAETAGSPGRKTSAGHMKLAYVLVFVGMTPELRIVAEIRS